MKTKFSLSAKSENCRKTAKFFGGKALTGSAKQKEWAEEIRAEKIQGMREEDAILCCNPNGVLRTASAWINNREKSSGEFASFIKEQTTLYQAAKSAKDNGQHNEYEQLAQEYNALTKKWGFE